jgi:Immunity protein 51
MNAPQPEWNIPENLLELVDADEGGIWEDDSWDPILLTVMKGTVYRGRHIPVAWQIEFEPVGPGFQVANDKLRKLGLEPDGYGWAALIRNVAEKYHPDLAKELRFDEELAACVVWVESEAACRQLIQMTWALINNEPQ